MMIMRCQKSSRGRSRFTETCHRSRFLPEPDLYRLVSSQVKGHALVLLAVDHLV